MDQRELTKSYSLLAALSSSSMSCAEAPLLHSRSTDQSCSARRNILLTDRRGRRPGLEARALEGLVDAEAGACKGQQDVPDLGERTVPAALPGQQTEADHDGGGQRQQLMA